MIKLFHFTIDHFLLLPIGGLVAIVWANTGPESYFTSAHNFAFVVNEVGMALFFLVCAFWLTGALLPWSASAFWSTVYWTDLAGRLPLVGHWLLVLIRGGEQVTGATLTRFFAAHVAVLPMAAVALMAAHFAIIRKLGVSEPL